MTYYEILGVGQDATYTEIRQNYRRLVKQYHPDINPTPEAWELIVRITEAYEVLSDPNKRALYNWRLLGRAPKQEPVINRQEHQRKAYIYRRRQEEQERWKHLFEIKVKFYKYQRYFACLFLFTGVVYTVDYTIRPATGPYLIERIATNYYGKTIGRIGYQTFTTSGDLFSEVKQQQADSAYLHLSGIFKLTIGTSLDGKAIHQFHHTLHSFNNFFAYLLLALALTLLLNKRYSDWSLTLGMLPFFITLFLLLMTYDQMRH